MDYGRRIRTLMEINTLPIYSRSCSDQTEQNSTSPSMFNTLLEEMLDNTSITDSLSSVSSTLLGNLNNIESLRYNGKNGVFEPFLPSAQSFPRHNNIIPFP